MNKEQINTALYYMWCVKRVKHLMSTEGINLLDICEKYIKGDATLKEFQDNSDIVINITFNKKFIIVNDNNKSDYYTALSILASRYAHKAVVSVILDDSSFNLPSSYTAYAAACEAACAAYAKGAKCDSNDKLRNILDLSFHKEEKTHKRMLSKAIEGTAPWQVN